MNVDLGTKLVKEKDINMSFIVVISKHKFWDKFTTQFLFTTRARDVPDARLIAREIFPMNYIEWKDEGLVAFFTGHIYES